mgnify:CR=1 FL=1
MSNDKITDTNIKTMNSIMSLFLLNLFVMDNYAIIIKDDLIILSINANKDSYPYIYKLDKNQTNLTNSYMSYSMNYSLMKTLSNEKI